MKWLQYEEILRNEYRDLAKARASIHEFIAKIYNQKRLHPALGQARRRVRDTSEGSK